MTRKLKFTLIMLLLALVSCLGIASAFSKYTQELNVGSINLSITRSFSGIVSTNADLIEAKKSGQDYKVIKGEETYTEYISADGVNVTVEDAEMSVSLANAFSVSNGGTLTIENAEETSNQNRMMLALVEGGTLIINGGTYSGASIVISSSGAGTAYITGGTFTVSEINGMAGMFYTLSSVIITGGTFSINPSTGVNVTIPDGYSVIENANGTWSVVCNHQSTATTWTKEASAHSGTCERCKQSINEAHTYDSDGNCLVCGFTAIVSSTQLVDAIESGAGQSADNPLIIGGGEWGEITAGNNCYFQIDAGTFLDYWQISNAYFVINGGTFDKSLLMWTDNATYIINGGNFTSTSVPFYTDVVGNQATVYIHKGTFDFAPINSDTSATFIIDGGTFGGKPNDECIANGYFAQDNGDGTWTVLPNPTT